MTNKCKTLSIFTLNDGNGNISWTVCISISISIIIVIICLMFMCQNRKYYGIFKRLPKYIRIVGCCTLILHVFEIFWFLNIFGSISNSKLENLTYINAGLGISFFTILFAIAWWNALKDWIICYYFRYYNDLSQNRWIKYIKDESKRNVERSWFIKNHLTRGSFIYMFKRSIIVILLYGIINFGYYMIIKCTSYDWNIYSTVSVGIIILMYGAREMYIISKIPRFIDDNNFKCYQIISNTIFIIGFCGYISAIIMYSVMDHDKHVYILIGELIACLLVLSFNLALMTFYAWNHSEKNIIIYDNEQPSITTTMDLFSKTYINVSELRMNRNEYEHFSYNFDKINHELSGSPKPGILQGNLELILSNPKGIMLFGQYLIKEMNIETLLAYIEFSQYQALCHTQFPIFKHVSNINNNDINGTPTIPAKAIPHIPIDQNDLTKIFPNNIPNSSIVYNNKKLSNKEKARQLCEKYMGNPSENNLLSDLEDTKHDLEQNLQGTTSAKTISFLIDVNINSEKKIYNTLNDNNFDDKCYEVSYIFNDVINELYHQMLKSCREFIKTKIGDELLTKIRQSKDSMVFHSLYSIN